MTTAQQDINEANRAIIKYRPWWRRRAHQNIFTVSIGYLILGLSMLLQPERWQLTPAYHDIFQVAPQSTWGSIFVGVAVGMLVAVFGFPRFRLLGQLSVTLTTALTFAWFGAFIIRWKLSENTTPYTWIFSGLVLLMLLQARVDMEAEYNAERG